MVVPRKGLRISFSQVIGSDHLVQCVDGARAQLLVAVALAPHALRKRLQDAEVGVHGLEVGAGGAHMPRQRAEYGFAGEIRLGLSVHGAVQADGGQSIYIRTIKKEKDSKK